jgi:hypothetical protein
LYSAINLLPNYFACPLAELSVGPLLAKEESERGAREAQLQQAEANFEPFLFDADAARAFGGVAGASRRAGRKTTARTYNAMSATTTIASDLPIYGHVRSDGCFAWRAARALSRSRRCRPLGVHVLDSQRRQPHQGSTSRSITGGVALLIKRGEGSLDGDLQLARCGLGCGVWVDRDTGERKFCSDAVQ